METSKGPKVHPATFPTILKLKDRWGLSYEDLSDLLEVSPSRVQQIVLFQRKKEQDDNSGTSSQP